MQAGAFQPGPAQASGYRAQATGLGQASHFAKWDIVRPGAALPVCGTLERDVSALYEARVSVGDLVPAGRRSARIV